MRKRLNALIPALVCLLMLPMAAVAQLPATTYGWNLGNTMEPPSGEGTWGNPPATQALINAVKAAGFNAIRIPVAWNSHANQQTYQIDPAWMARVKQVVDWSLAANMTVIINSHWDNGWFDNNGNCSRFNTTLNNKFQSYWTQIANAFVNYDSRLIFCAANEPDIRSQAETTELIKYYQTFVNAVRATGGQNTNRWLMLPGPSTNHTKTYDWFTLPTDPTPNRLMIDVHYYEPFQYSLMDQDANWGKMFYFWGAAYHTSVSNLLDRNPNWNCEEAFMEGEFQKMHAKFTSKGVPVIVGEFCAIRRTSGYAGLTGTEFDRHMASRTYYNKKVLDFSKQYGLKPFYWDAGDIDNNGSAVINRNTLAIVDQPVLTAVTGGAAVPPPSGGGGTATSMSVSAIVVGTASAPRGQKRGQAQVTIRDNLGNAVSGATVTGNFSGTFNETGKTATTNSSGVATLQTTGTAKTVGVTFCVTGVSKSGLTYNASGNTETCDNN